MLKIGIIGLGPNWESEYRPALLQLSRRLRVSAVYDPVFSRAEPAAEELRAVAVAGIRALLARPDVRAVLILDTAWQRDWPVRFAIASGKATYVAAPIPGPLSRLEELSCQAGEQNSLLMPELRLRTIPTTTRIHELAATQLGAVQRMQVRFHTPDTSDRLFSLVSLIDWCSEIVRSTPVGLEAPPDGEPPPLVVKFRRLTAAGAPVSAELRVVPTEPEGRAPFPAFTATIECLHGGIELISETELSWRRDAREVHERLDKEQPGAQVLLAHFARRVVGGLVPVPGFDDLCRVLRLLDPHRTLIAERFQVNESDLA